MQENNEKNPLDAEQKNDTTDKNNEVVPPTPVFETIEHQNHLSEDDQDIAQTTPPDSERLEKEVAEYKEKYVRLLSDFENFRKRTAKEKIELQEWANADFIKAILPALDDFERAFKYFQSSQEITVEIVKDGMGIVYNKLFQTLEKKGIKMMDLQVGSDFNPDEHEAITQIPAPSEELKGKIVDVVEKGYYLGEKVIRFAKVIIGS
jgi:molecular chaperone GrpE